MIFKKKSDYLKIGDNSKPLTKNIVLKKISEEFKQHGLETILLGNEIILQEINNEIIGVSFGISNYADKDKVELISSIFLKNGDKYRTWQDLFSICKSVYGMKYRALVIHKDEQWNGSNIRKECLEVYIPLFKMFRDDDKLERIKMGKKFELGKRKISMWPVQK
jgi:hypothetical protein